MKLAYDIPILLLIFNRPDTTMAVLDAIRKIQPSHLFIASDGARASKPKELETVLLIRNMVLKGIDWPCKVETLFRSENLGCKAAVSSAVDWMFEHSPRGIILEDDCVPNESFFFFCKEMLLKYENEERVLSISGFNPINKTRCSESYIFSDYFFSWGWATWKRAWKKMDFNLLTFPKIIEYGGLKTIYPNLIERKIREKRIYDVINNHVNSWAIPWNTVHHMYKCYSIIPCMNLVHNIGFSNEISTHTKEDYWDNIFLNHISYDLKTPLVHPANISKNHTFHRIYIGRETLRISLKKLKDFFIKQ